jgi:hypothetical protein
MFSLIVTGIAVGVLILLMICFPAFRLLAIVAIFLGSAVVWWIIDRDQARRALAHQLIGPEQIELADLKVNAQDSPRRLTGLIRNNSSYVLTELIIRVSALDCPAQSEGIEDCETLVDGLAREHSPWRIQPRQARDIDVDFRLGELPPPRGELRWMFAVVETRASLDP